MSRPTAPRFLARRIYAPPGKLLVQRLEMPGRSGRIILPFSSREYNRAAEAVVVDANCDGFLEGDCVVLTGTVSRFLTFGDPPDELTLWLCNPDQVLFRLFDRSEYKVDVGEDHWQKYITSEEYERQDVEGWAEGEPHPAD